MKQATFTEADRLVVDAIVERALPIMRAAGLRRTRLSLRMDIALVHARYSLRLRELRDADAANFLHDVFGIMRHLNRKNGKLMHCFVPRFARRGN